MSEEELAILLYTTWSESDPEKARAHWESLTGFLDRSRFRNQARALLPLLFPDTREGGKP